MNLEMTKSSLQLCQLICDEKKRFLVEGEVNVPDIKPDLLNLVHVYADSFITGREVMEGRVKIEGVVDTYLIYLAEDEEGSTKSITYSFHFTEYFDIPDVTENSLFSINAHVLGVDARVISSRKVNVKINMELHVQVFQQSCIDVLSEVEENHKAQTLMKKYEACTLIDAKSDVVNVNETISLENNPPIGEILKASIHLMGTEYKTSFHKVLTKTEALVKMIYVADNESMSIQRFETRIPVMGFVEFENLEDSMKIFLESRVKNFSIKPIYQDMKATSFMVESDVVFDVSVYQDKEINVLSDIYYLDKTVIPHFDCREIVNHSVNTVEEWETVQSLLIPDLDLLKILDIEVTPNVTNMDILDGKISMEGNLSFDVLYYRTDKKVVENKRMELPFRQVMKVDTIKHTMAPQVVVNVEEVSFQVVGQNELRLELKMKASISNLQNQKITMIQSVETKEEELPNLPSVIVYFVKPNDTLWKLAKRFKTTIEVLKKVNELEGDTIYPGQQIIIPKQSITEESLSLS